MKYCILFLCVSVFFTTASEAQMVKGGKYAGVRVGLGARDNTFAFSLDFDYLLMKEREFGPGSVAVGVSIDASLSSKSGLSSQTGGDFKVKTTFIPVSFHTSYHFGPMMDDKRIDPYLLVGLAYRIISVGTEYPDKFSSLNLTSNFNDVILVGCLGCRYSFSPRWAAHGRLGFGSTFFSAGVSMTID